MINSNRQIPVSSSSIFKKEKQIEKYKYKNSITEILRPSIRDSSSLTLSSLIFRFWRQNQSSMLSFINSEGVSPNKTLSCNWIKINRQKTVKSIFQAETASSRRVQSLGNATGSLCSKKIWLKCLDDLNKQISVYKIWYLPSVTWLGLDNEWPMWYSVMFHISI